MANNFRNELDVTLGDKTYRLRATFGFIAEIENLFNSSMYEIVTNRAASGRLRAIELKAIYQAAIKAGGEKVSDDEIETAILKVGLIAATSNIIPFLAQTFEGAPVNTEEKKT